MKEIPFYNRTGHQLVDCIMMALLYFEPWASPDENGHTYPNPTLSDVWQESFQRRLFPSYEGNLSSGLKVLREEGLSGTIFSTHNRGYPKDRMFLEGLNNYDHTNYIILACINQGMITHSEVAGTHKVLLLGVDRNQVVYHDPFFSNGAYLTVSKDTFFDAWNLYGFSTYGSAANNALAVWDQDRMYPPTRVRNMQEKRKPSLPAPTASFFQSFNKNPFEFIRHHQKTKDHSRAGTPVMKHGPKNILFVSKEEQRDLAGLTSAIELTKLYKSKLEILYLCDESSIKDHPNQLSKDTSKSLESIKSLESLKDHHVNWFFESGDIQTRTLIHLDKYKNDFVVMGEKELSATRELAMYSTIPFWIEKGSLDIIQNRWHNILVPFDGSRFSFLALQEAIYLSSKHGGTINILHVCTSEAERENSFNRILTKVDWKGIQYEYEEVIGDPAQHIYQQAKQLDSSLIIMGTMGKDHPQDPDPARSITSEVINHCGCSVLVVYPKPLSL